MFNLANGMSREQMRTQWKDDEFQWVVQAPEDICGICFQQSDSKLAQLSCHKTHQFCNECINTWREQQSTCPLCRVPIVDSILCTCFKAMTKPSVLILLASTCASATKLLENMNECMTGISCKNNCAVCVGLTASGACAFCLGIKIYQMRHCKNN